MDIKPYLKIKKLIPDLSGDRPRYVGHKIYSLFRPVTTFCRQIADDPDKRGVTEDNFKTEETASV